MAREVIFKVGNKTKTFDISEFNNETDVKNAVMSTFTGEEFISTSKVKPEVLPAIKKAYITVSRNRGTFKVFERLTKYKPGYETICWEIPTDVDFNEISKMSYLLEFRTLVVQVVCDYHGEAFTKRYMDAYPGTYVPVENAKAALDAIVKTYVPLLDA